jgi:hypothetical protein
MLGLLDTDGHIAPDLTDDELRTLGSPITAVNSDLGEHLPMAKRGPNVYTPPPLNGELCPPGLRAVIQGAPPVDTPTTPTPVKLARKVIPAPPKARTPRQPRKPRPYVPRPPRPPQPLQPCGTEAAYRRHNKHGEPIDEACRDARNEANRRRDKARREAKIAAGLTIRRKVAQCGTASGYKRHARQGTPKCQPCLDAKAAETKKYAAIRRPTPTAAQAA